MTVQTSSNAGPGGLQRGLSATFHAGSQVWVPVEAPGRSSAKDKRRMVHWRRGVVQVQCVVVEQVATFLGRCSSVWAYAGLCRPFHFFLSAGSLLMPVLPRADRSAGAAALTPACAASIGAHDQPSN